MKHIVPYETNIDKSNFDYQYYNIFLLPSETDQLYDNIKNLDEKIGEEHYTINIYKEEESIILLLINKSLIQPNDIKTPFQFQKVGDSKILQILKNLDFKTGSNFTMCREIPKDRLDLIIYSLKYNL